MLLNILSVGNKLSEWESAGISYYLKQLPKTVDINFINIKGQQHPKKSKNEILKSESEMIVSKIPTENFIISWDSNGEKLNSIELSQFFERAMTNNIKINIETEPNHTIRFLYELNSSKREFIIEISKITYLFLK